MEQTKIYKGIKPGKNGLIDSDAYIFEYVSKLDIFLKNNCVRCLKFLSCDSGKSLAIKQTKNFDPNKKELDFTENLNNCYEFVESII